MFTISADNLIADEAKVAEQLMVVSLAVGETFLFVMSIAQTWFLTFGAHEMLRIQSEKFRNVTFKVGC